MAIQKRKGILLGQRGGQELVYLHASGSASKSDSAPAWRFRKHGFDIGKNVTMQRVPSYSLLSMLCGPCTLPRICLVVENVLLGPSVDLQAESLFGG